MTEHERVVAAAKAGIAQAHELGLPPADPKRGVVHEFEQQLVRLEKVIADDATSNANLRRSVAQLLRAVKVIVPALIVFVVVFAALSIVAFGRLDRIATENRRLALDNASTQRAAAIAVKKTAVQARVVIRETCERQNRDRGKLRAIIERGEASIPKLVAEGTLTQAQADRSLRDSRRARRELHNDRCSKRAARIPIPAVPK